MTALTATDLSLSIPTADGERVLLASISFVLSPGRCVGVIGASGAGKTRLGELLVGVAPRAARVAGTLSVEALSVAAADRDGLARLRAGRVGAVFQDPGSGLCPHRRLKDQWDDVRRAVAHRGAGAPTIDWFQKLGLGSSAASLARFPFELSGGERQRAAMALTLAAGPRFLIADEPTSALDPPLALELLQVLRGLTERDGLGLLFISHELAHVAAIADEVLVLYAGRVVESGPVADVLGRPRHPYTAALVGRLPVVVADADLPGDLPAGGCTWAHACASRTSACAREPGPVPSGAGLIRCHHPMVSAP